MGGFPSVVERLPAAVGGGADAFVGERAGVEREGAAKDLLGECALLFGGEVSEASSSAWVSQLMKRRIARAGDLPSDNYMQRAGGSAAGAHAGSA
jgi:hypothetical protein